MSAVSPPLQTYLTALAEQWRKTGHAAVADELDALIGTPTRQHVMESSCWCNGWKAPNGAYNHRHVP